MRITRRRPAGYVARSIVLIACGYGELPGNFNLPIIEENKFYKLTLRFLCSHSVANFRRNFNTRIRNLSQSIGLCD